MIWGKSKWYAAQFQYILKTLNLGYNKNKLHKTSDYWSRDTPSFNFPEKGLEPVSAPHFVYNFSRKLFLMLHSINRLNFIIWLTLLLEIFIAIVCWSGCDVIKFGIFLVKPFYYMTKKSRLKLKYLESEKSFWVETKSIFHHF